MGKSFEENVRISTARLKQGINMFELDTCIKNGYGSYSEFTYVGENVTQIDYWSNSGKSLKLFTKVINYNDSNASEIIVTDEITGIVLTTTIGYTGDEVTSVTKVIT
jgi:hypothetical protein